MIYVRFDESGEEELVNCSEKELIAKIADVREIDIEDVDLEDEGISVFSIDPDDMIELEDLAV